MRILNVHNYHMARGGMEVIYDCINNLFRERGDEVIELSRDSANLNSPIAKLTALGSSVYSRSAYKEARELIEKHQPEVAYVHNLYPMLSTSVVDACRDTGVATVLNVEDYKLTCPMAQHLRDGAICTKCLDGSVLWSAVHSCKGGKLTSAAYAVSHGITRMRRSYHTGFDLYTTPARFAAEHLAKAGFDRSRIVVVPNMCDLPDVEPSSGGGTYAAYVGRISPEKGIQVLIEAARMTGIPVKIAGKGDVPGLRESAPPHVEFVGTISRENLPNFYRGARFLVVPSVWYEVFGLIIAEAMNMGIPVIASDIGGMPEVLEADKSGLLFKAGDAPALAAAMQRLWDDPALCAQMGQSGRLRARNEFGPDLYYSRLKSVFEKAISLRKRASNETAEQSLAPLESTV